MHLFNYLNAILNFASQDIVSFVVAIIYFRQAILRNNYEN